MVSCRVNAISNRFELKRFGSVNEAIFPDLEEAFSKVKAYIRDNEVAYQSTSTPRIIVAEAFNTVSTCHIQDAYQCTVR